MSHRLRRAFVASTLLFLVLWPLAQHTLHRSHAVGAWKLFGLGVYCRPKLLLRLEVDVDGHPYDLARLHPETHAAFASLRVRTRELGMLASADDAACRLLHEEGARSVTVRRLQDELDAEGRIRTRRDAWIVADEVCSQPAYADAP